MPTIQLSNNTTLNLTGSSADNNATLNRYLKNPLSFITPAALGAIAGKKVADLDPAAFPIVAGATGQGQFAVEGTSLAVQLGASASICFLKGNGAADFFDALQWTQDPAVAGLVSFAIQGTLSAGDTATVSDFCLGVSKSANVTLTSFCTVAGTDSFADAAGRAIAGLTIPHDLNDLKSLPANTVCQIDASGSIKFTASVTYSILNDPLATKSIPNLPAFAVNATAGATLEGTATHTADHTITIAKLANGRIHLSVSLTKTDDFETSLTVSAGATATVGNTDAIAFLLGKISPNSVDEVKKLQTDMPAAQAHQLSCGIKAAIDAALCNSLQVSLKAALDDSRCTNRIFLYEIDLSALDANSTAAIQSALKGDFTAITGAKALTGIQKLDSALTVTSSVTHSLTLHLLGIFNWGSTNEFVKSSTVDYTKDTHEIVLSDETIKVVTNNLQAEKLREVVVKGVTLTLPASANTPAATTPINILFFDRQGSTSASALLQFVNVLHAINAPGAAGAAALLDKKLKNYGTSSLYLGLNLNPVQCKQLFLDSSGHPYDWTTYLRYLCAAESTILSGDSNNAERLRLFSAGEAYWKQLKEAGSSSAISLLLSNQGFRQPSAMTDVLTAIWWSGAMANYAQALAAGKSLVDAGKNIVKDGTLGYSEPWLVLAAWNMLQKPAVQSIFTSSLLKLAGGSAV